MAAPEEKNLPPAPYPKSTVGSRGRKPSKKIHGLNSFNQKIQRRIQKWHVLTVISWFLKENKDKPPVVLFSTMRDCSKVLRYDSMTRQCPVLEHVFLNSTSTEDLSGFSTKDIQHLGRTHGLFSGSLDWSSLLHIKIVKLHVVSWIFCPLMSCVMLLLVCGRVAGKRFLHFNPSLTGFPQCHMKGCLHIATFLFGF